MLKIRLMRIGAKQRPFYRVVAVDERSKRNGAYVELLGTYNPLTEPKEIKLNQERIDHWLKQGAQPSDGFLRIIGKAPQRPPRKPKKEKKEAPAPAVAPVETPSEETPTPANTSDGGPDEGGHSSKVEVSEEKIATEPEAPRNDESVEEKEDERPA